MNESADKTALTPGLTLNRRLAERVVELLRAEIRCGRWWEHLPPERALAAEFQVSRPTLHLALRALEREGWVTTAARKPWRIIRPEPGQRPSGSRRPEVIVLQLSRLKYDVAGDVLWIDPLRERLHRIGLGLSLRDPFTKRSGDLSRTLSAFDAENRASFYILASVPPSAHHWFRAQRLPALIFGSSAPGGGLPTVDIDHLATVRHAVSYLLRRGHRRIGLLNLPPTGVGAASLTEMFLRSCAAWPKGLVEPTVELALERPSAIESAFRRMFARRATPTAVITADLEMTMGAYTLLAQMGHRIPQGVSVLPLFHWPSLDFLWPTPTTYRFNWETLAARMTRIIANFLRLGVLPKSTVKIIPVLREGRSVATLPAE